MSSRADSLSAASDRTLRLLSLAGFVSMASMRWGDALVPVLAAEWGRSTGDTASVVYAFAVAYGLMQLLFGPLGDRLGKFRVVSYATAGCALAVAACACAPSLAWLTVARFLTGAFAAAIVPLTMAWVGDHVPWERRQSVLARMLGYTVAGMITGQWLSGVFADSVGWRFGFGTLAAGFAVVALGMRWYGPTQPASDAHAAPSAAMSPVARMRAVVQLPAARQVLLVVAAEGAFAFSPLAFAPTHLHERLALSVSTAAAIIALYGAGGLIYTRTVTLILRHISALTMARIGAWMVGTCWFLLAWVPHWAWALPLCLVAGLGFYMVHNTLQTRATQMAPDHRGTAMSLFASALFIGQSLGMLLSAWMLDHWGTAVVLATCGVGLITVGVQGVRRLPPDPAVIGVSKRAVS